MQKFISRLGGLALVALWLLTFGQMAMAREYGNDPTVACSHDLEAELSGKTIFGIAAWGEQWVEYHDPSGVTVLSNIDLSDPKPGTWSSDNCMEVCYSYPDGNGWCPQWRQVDGDWINVFPGTDQVVHRIFLIEDGDVMDLMRHVDQIDAPADQV